MEAKGCVRCGIVALLLVGILAVLATPPLFAQAVIPEGATINQAVFSISVGTESGQNVNVHRILGDWGESSVSWFSFNNDFDPTVIGAFTATWGWQSVDLTALVQDWVDGNTPNFGILLEQGSTDFSRYWSSEYEVVEHRPRLEISYTDPSGVVGEVLIQRPGDAQDGVADAYLWELMPNFNGNSRSLYTGLFDGWEKYSLIRFHFIVEPPNTPPGTGCPWYWKSHPNAWPVEIIDIGGITYTREEAIAIMRQPVRRDMTKAMFRSLVAAKLNVLIGNDDSCIWPDIQAGDVWLMDYPLGSGVRAGGRFSPWREGGPIHHMLNNYNRGLLGCADHRG